MDTTQLSTLRNLTTPPTPTSTETVYQRGPSYLYIRGIGAVTFSILGTILNSVSLLVLFKLANIKNTQIVLVINMCTVNFLYCATILPVFGYIQLVGPLPHTQCLLYSYFSHTFQGLVMTTLFLITLHRYFLVIFPNSRYLTMGGCRKTLIVIAILYAIIHFLMAFPLTGITAQYGYDELLLNCTLIRDKSRIFSIFFTFLGVGLPLVLKLIAYGHIFLVIYRQRRKIEHSSDNQTRTRHKVELRLTVVCCLLVIVYTISYVPYSVASASPKLEQNDYLHGIATVLLYFHMVVNPILYLYGDGKIREKITAVWTRRKPSESVRIVTISVNPQQEQ